MKFYSIAELDITDPGWVPAYVQNVTPMVERFGGRYLTRSSHVDMLEGTAMPGRVIVIVEWPSREAAQSFYESDEYRPYRESRTSGAKNTLFLVPAEDVARVAKI